MKRDLASSALTIAFAGGGTGGHIYPNVGIAESLATLRPELRAHFVVSSRPGDTTTMGGLDYAWHANAAQPLPNLGEPLSALRFAKGWTHGSVQAAALLRRERVDAVVATGGFVSGPTIIAARMLGIPAVMVNLDAVPGAANRALVRLCRKVFTAYPSDRLPGAEVVGLPLRRVSVGGVTPSAARQGLGLDPDRPVLFVTGATHGAQSIIEACMALLGTADFVSALDGWQVLHQCGTFDVQRLQRAYDDAGVCAVVVDYLSRMGQAYAAADLVLSRAGAGSVAEAWANGCPTVYLPNPYHADQHQRLNAQPMVDAGGASMLTDHIAPEKNLPGLGAALAALFRDDATRQEMAKRAADSRPPDGAEAVAQWLDGHFAEH